MINIRYHIVSITAVFLALGIGVALGSTFLDRATVDVLDRNIRNAENRIRETDDENGRLRAEVERSVERDAGLIIAGTGELLDGHLTDAPIVVIAAPGVDDGETAALTNTLERSGADLRATISLRDRLAFDGEVDADLAAELGAPDASTVVLRREVLGRLSDALAAAGAPIPPDDGPVDPEGRGTEDDGTGPDAEGSGSAEPDGSADPDDPGATGPDASDPAAEPAFGQPAIIEQLRDRDYLRITPGPGLGDEAAILDRPGHRYVFVGSPDIDESQSRLLLALLEADAEAEALPAVVVTRSAPVRADDDATPTAVDLVRADEVRASRYSTVDNIETFAGLVATVLTLEDLGIAATAHFGQAEGAVAILPPAP